MRFEHAVVRQRVLDDHLHGILRPDQSGQQIRATPTRDESEVHFRQCDDTGCCADRAVGAVQGEFETATECHTVDEGERRDLEIADAAVDLVPHLGNLSRCLAARHDATGAKVGTSTEAVGLAGDEQRLRVGAFDLVDRVVERCDAAGTERVRAVVILAVVERDDRARRAVRELEVAQYRACDLLVGAHLPASTFSQITLAPIPRPMHIVVSA